MTTRTNEIRTARNIVEQFAKEQGITLAGACTITQEFAAKFANAPQPVKDIAERTIENMAIIKRQIIREEEMK